MNADTAGQTVIDRLLSRWRANADVEAVLLFGSYASDSATLASDIDLCVIHAPGVSWTEPGLERIDKILVEIFGGTREFFEGFFEKFHADNSRIGQTQFATAKVFFDRTGQAEAIRAAAREWLAKPRIRQAGPEQTYWPKRIIWTNFLRLEEAFAQRRPDFAYVVHHYLHLVYAKYAAFLGQPVMDTYRTWRYFTDPRLRERYLLEDFPDDEFAREFVLAMAESEPMQMLGRAVTVRDRALIAMGGFTVPEIPYG